MVGGAGLLTSIFGNLTTAVRERGGTDEHIHRLTRPEGQKTIGEMADLIVGINATYELPVNYDDPQWQTIQRDRYAYVGEVTVDNYLITEKGTKTVRFRELAFDHDVLDDEVLARMEQLNCRQPNRAEVETVIRERYTPEQLGKNPRIGLIGPAVRRGGDLDRACVRGRDGGVSLSWGWTEVRWDQQCRFVVVCK